MWGRRYIAASAWARLAVIGPFVTAAWVVLDPVSTLQKSAKAETPSGTPSWHYFYFHSQRPLTLDLTRVAVRAAKGAELSTVTGGTPGLSPVNDPLEEGSFPSLPFVEVESASRDADRIQELVARLARNNAVEFASPVFLDDRGEPIVMTPELLVGFESDVEEAAAQSLLDATGAGAIQVRDWAGMPNVYRVASHSRSGFEVLAAANALAEREAVRFAEPNVYFRGQGSLIPSDPLFPWSWGLHNIGQSSGVPDADMDGPEAWDVTTGSPDIIAAIIDTGVDPFHADLNQVAGFDVTDEGPGDGRPNNEFDNHGTAVAGCFSARINNGQGSTGVAPSCKTASVRTFVAFNAAGNWNALSSWTVDALSRAESIGARITNNSNAYGFTSSATAAKYAQTRDQGMVHFASVHNNGVALISYPAILPSVNAVAAVDRFGVRPSFSNHGPGLDFSAPGHEILTTDRSGSAGYLEGDYLVGSGTSFASPYAAGIAGLVLSRNPALSASAVEQMLNDSCVDLGEPGYDTDFGWGFMNAERAVALADPEAVGACCVAGQCVGDASAVVCHQAGQAEPSTRWFGLQPCGAVQCPPANTRCELAVAVGANSATSFDNSNLTNLPSPSFGCGIEEFHDGTLWFRFVADAVSARIHTCDSSATDSTFTVYDACGSKMELACGEDDVRCAASPYLADQCLQGLSPGQAYFVQVSAWSSGDRGTYTLSLQSPCPPPAPLPGPSPILQNRALAVRVEAGLPTAQADPEVSAIHVTLVDLQTPVPPNPLLSPPPNFSAYESGSTCNDPLGCARWVGPPVLYYEHPASTAAGSFRAARLQCMPCYHTWPAEGVFHIIGAEILPSSTYDVRIVPAACIGSEGQCNSVSSPLRVVTARHGDIGAPFNPPEDSDQPDGLDIVAMVDKFRGVPGAPSKTVAQLRLNAPEPNAEIDARDIVTCLDAYKGSAYPHSGPCPCPSAVICNNTPCSSSSDCHGGGVCTGTCVGGVKEGIPCEEDAHCPGASCGPRSCRDACNRCTP